MKCADGVGRRRWGGTATTTTTPGGPAAISSTPRAYWASSGWGRLAVVEFKKRRMEFGPPLEVRLSPAEVERLAAAAGFGKEDSFEAGPYSFAVVFSR